jgi:hypothetical protein
MKRFSDLMESCTTADVNQGNSLALGVTNHLTPVNNIVTNVRNLFASVPVIASVGEDGVSVKLNSTRFVNKDEINKILYEPIWQSTSLSSYIISQGLDLIKMINLGVYWVVYFSPRDIAFAQPGAEPKQAVAPVKEQFNEEVEMDALVNESDDDEELKDLTKKKLQEIIDSKDKVKSAKQLELLVAQELELPREYYFAGVKDKQGLESIALRWKYTSKRPKGKTAEMTRSLINIFNTEDGVWVGDFDEDSYFKLPDEVKKLIESILEFLGAEKTDDPCVWELKEKDNSDKGDEENKDNEESSDNKSEEENKEDKGEKEDVEDDKSREGEDLI